MFSVNVEWIASPTIHILLNGLLPSVFMYIVYCTPFVKEVISWLPSPNADDPIFAIKH